MEPRSLNLIYFSPTGNCRRTARQIAKGMGMEAEEYDRTLPKSRLHGAHFTGRDLAVIVLPSYGQRLPRIIEGIFAGITADRTPAVFVVTYGNNDYGDALLELKNIASKKGFIGVAAAAVPSEHAYTPTVGSGRPDANDLESLEQFGWKVALSLREKTVARMNLTLKIPGEYPYKATPMKLQKPPALNALCKNTMLCVANCPMGAISSKNPAKIDASKCLSCGHCIRICPNKAREVVDEQIKLIIEFLEYFCKARKEAEFFV